MFSTVSSKGVPSIFRTGPCSESLEFTWSWLALNQISSRLLSCIMRYSVVSQLLTPSEERHQSTHIPHARGRNRLDCRSRFKPQFIWCQLSIPIYLRSVDVLNSLPAALRSSLSLPRIQTLPFGLSDFIQGPAGHLCNWKKTNFIVFLLWLLRLFMLI